MVNYHPKICFFKFMNLKVWPPLKKIINSLWFQNEWLFENKIFLTWSSIFVGLVEFINIQLDDFTKFLILSKIWPKKFFFWKWKKSLTVEIKYYIRFYVIFYIQSTIIYFKTIKSPVQKLMDVKKNTNFISQKYHYYHNWLINNSITIIGNNKH